jgi:hypothetical protein
VFVSCEDTATDVDNTIAIQNDTVKELISVNYAKFTMPPPVDLFINMWEMELNFSKDAVNSPDNLKNYNTSVRKAIGLGAYSSDLSYTSVYGQNQLTMNYFQVSKKLADDLGLTEGFDQKIVQRINDNLSNADSLYNITKDSYSDAINQVASSEQAYLLPYIVFGGWIESIYVAAIAGDANKANEVSINTFSEQGIFLENLIDYYSTISKADPENEDIKSILKDLNSIYELYNDALESDDMTLSQEQFDKIKSKVIVIREKWLM